MNYRWIALLLSLIGPLASAAEPVCDLIDNQSAAGIAAASPFLQDKTREVRDAMDRGDVFRLETLLEQDCTGNCRSIAPWITAQARSRSVRELAYRIQLRLVRSRLAERDGPTAARSDATFVKETLARALQNRRFQYSPQAHEKIRKLTSLLMKSNPNLRKGLLASGPMCAALSLPDTVACTAALDQLLRFVRPTLLSGLDFDPPVYSFSMYFAFPEIQERIFTDPIYRRVLARLALRMMEHAERSDRDAHFWEDLAAAITREAPPPPASDRARIARDIVLYYSFRGASMDGAFPYYHPEHLEVLAAFSVISSLLNVLDAVSFESSRTHYSLPASAAQTECLIPKPYHFWMAAGLAMELQSRGFSPRISELAIHLSGVMYEYNSSTSMRSLSGNAVDRERTSIHNQSIRLNLAMKDLGILWQTRLRSPDVDSAFGSLFESARDLRAPVLWEGNREKKSSAIATVSRKSRNYLLWRAAFAPDTLIR